MNLRYFGDSYDIVKKSMIGWLSSFGKWDTHPMFTEPVAPRDADAFAAFLATPLLSSEVLTSRTDRTRYFARCFTASHLFLDPDTGVRSANARRSSPSHIYATELVSISSARPAKLTLVFDQSFARGATERGLAQKFAYFNTQGVAIAAYRSQAPFLLLASDAALLSRAVHHVIMASGLPSSRFVMRGPGVR